MCVCGGGEITMGWGRRGMRGKAKTWLFKFTKKKKEATSDSTGGEFERAKLLTI